jgi:hypothetical protein
MKRSTAALILCGMISLNAQAGHHTPMIEFVGEAQIPTGTQFENTEIGGLSGIDYDAAQNSYVAISDDRAQINHARFYELSIDLTDGYLNDGDISFLQVTEILDSGDFPFAPASLDPEAIRILPFPNLLVWTSEGDANNGIAPSVRIMSRDGHYIDEFGLPGKFVPTATSGIRNNLAFESLSFSHDRSQVITATENALLQDGPSASTSASSPVRVLILDTQTGQPGAEYIYRTEPIAADPVPADGFATNGLVELLVLNKYSMLALERSFSVGIGNSIKLFLTSTKGATNVRGKDSIDGKHVRPLRKHLILDLDQLGITLDNIEGMTFGPDYADGSKSLILVSDNNFSDTQFTQFLAFRLYVNH